MYHVLLLSRYDELSVEIRKKKFLSHPVCRRPILDAPQQNPMFKNIFRKMTQPIYKNREGYGHNLENKNTNPNKY